MSRILLVDDEKNTVLVIKMSLEKAGYEVDVACDGLTALEKVQETKPDLVLLDIVLPKMNGFLVFEAIRDDSETAEIPVIFISARAEPEDLDKAYELGARDYLVKPIKQEQLLGSIEKALEGSFNNGD